jgi:hypothetical protein
MESIPSPFVPAKVTKEIVEEVMKANNFQSVFIAASNEDPNHECTPEKCKGHEVSISGFGFTNIQMLAIADIIAKACGYKLVPNEEIK